MNMGTHSVWTGKDLFRNGVWCIKDMGTDEYKHLQALSQKRVSWASNEAYGHYMIYFCVVVIFLFFIKRIVYHFTDCSSRLSNGNSNLAKRFYYKAAAINRWVGYRRLPKLICNIFQLPSSLGNFLLIAGGCLFMLCYTFIPGYWYRECRGFGSPPLAVRTGLQSTALLPIIIILSGKTNLISQLTDISYEKLNVYHRWVSIMCCFLGWVHVIPFYIQAYREGGSERLAYFQSHNKYFVNGIPPLVFLTVLTIFSHSYIRAVWYELWLQIHWICAIGMYISLFIHAYPSLNAWKYLVATVVFWFAQLLWRAVRKGMLRPNGGFLRPNKCRMRRFTSNNEKEHFFEIVVENSNDFSWLPGQHLFVKIPGLRCLESHPFSILSICEPRGDSDIKLLVKTGGLGGLTRYLYDKLPDTGYTESNIYIDGPYGGCSRQTGSFESVFLMASGTGISAIIPFLNEACREIKKGESITEYVQLDWFIRQSENIEWILPELETIVSHYSDLVLQSSARVNIHVKEDMAGSDSEFMKHLRDSFSQSSSSESESKEELSLKPASTDLITIVNAKSNVLDIIKDAGEKLQPRNVFVVSGSDSMKTQVSNSVASLQARVFDNTNVQEIYLHSESFGW